MALIYLTGSGGTTGQANMLYDGGAGTSRIYISSEL